MKVVFCTPTRERPHDAYLAALEASAPALDAAGIEHSAVFEIGCPYISHARAAMLRKAMDAGADAVVFIDDDLAWEPEGLIKLINAPAEVVAGLYRFKTDDERYMGTLYTGHKHAPIRLPGGLILAEWVPAGFLKVTREAVRQLMRAHPDLVYGDPLRPHFDLFNHGAHEGVWYGEDYAFSRRWGAIESVSVLADLNLAHHHGVRAYPGNFHQFMLRQPGGSDYKENPHDAGMDDAPETRPDALLHARAG